MNKQTKIRTFTLLLIFAVSFSAMAQPDIKDLQKSVTNFSKGLAETLPFNASLGLNWSDAYIGKAFPGVPHFGVGGSFGVTTMSTPAMKALAGLLDTKLPLDVGKLPLPAYTAELRVGGFILPFDAGLKFGSLSDFELFGIGTSFLLIGGDIRYAILDKPILPKISVGIGFNYLDGSISTTIGSTQTFKYRSSSIVLNKPETEFKWNTKSLDIKAQISKSFLIVTPYLGLGASYAWSEAGYSVTAKVTNDAGDNLSSAEKKAINDYLKRQGLNTVNLGNNGISSIIKSNSFNLRTFGGVSFNLALFKIDLTGLYSILDNNYGGSLGLRFQL